jgi:hypothetical protein
MRSKAGTKPKSEGGVGIKQAEGFSNVLLLISTDVINRYAFVLKFAQLS